MRAARRSMSTTRAARSASSARCCRRRARARLYRDRARRISQGRRRACAQRGRQAAPAARQGARQRAQARLGAYAPPTPQLSRRARASRPTISPSSSRYIDWTPFFQTWELKGRYPAILDDEKQGAAARQLFDDAQAMLKRIVAERWFAPKAVVGFWPADARSATTSASSRTRRATRARDVLHACASNSRKRDGRPNLALADFVAPPTAASRLCRRLRRHRGRRGGRDRRALRARQRRLFVDPGEGARRPLRRGARRSACTRACAANSGAMRRTRLSRREELHRRALSRHPPGARLSRAARPHREGDAVPPARRRSADRRAADRELRDVAGLLGVAASISRIPTRIISASPRSSAIRSRITRRAKAWRSREVERWLAPVLNYAPAPARSGGVGPVFRSGEAAAARPPSACIFGASPRYQPLATRFPAARPSRTCRARRREKITHFLRSIPTTS